MSSEKQNGSADPLPELLEEMEPQLKELLARFRIPASEAEAMLEDCLMVLIYRQDQIVDPRRWLHRTLRYRCLRHWRQHQERVCRALDAELRRWLEDEGVSASERQGRRRLLEREIERLPGPCRPVLRARLELEDGGALRGGVGNRPRGNAGHRDPYNRCLTRLMRQLLENAQSGLEKVKILSASPP
jgi:DNA-directed RNA polymerase specialized sigma24 family protein